MIVEKGANLKKAASVSMRGMFANAGQLCISIERVYVERDVMDEFLQHLKNRLDKLVIAANYEYSTEFGSIISEKQAQKIDGHVKDAVAKGSKVFYGGKRLPEIGPLYYSPTVLLDVPEGAEVRENETFGPSSPSTRWTPSRKPSSGPTTPNTASTPPSGARPTSLAN